MFYQDYTTGGTWIPSGDTYHDVAIAMKDKIIGVAGSPWTEVTGSGPTPVWLQPFATTAVAARDSSNSSYNGWDQHVTMYMDTDPALLTRIITCTGSSGTTLRIDIDGVDYDQAWNTSIAQTVTDWLTTHTATLAGLSPSIVVITGGSAIINITSISEYVITDESIGGDIAFTWTANCVMIRIVIGYHGVNMTIIDTYQGTPGTTTHWACLTKPTVTWNPDTSSTSYYQPDDSPLFTFKFDSSQLTCPEDGVYRFFTFMWDECFSILSKSESNVANSKHAGGVTVWHPAVSSLPGLTRATFPHIWGYGMNMGHISSAPSDGSQVMPWSNGGMIGLPRFEDQTMEAFMKCDTTSTLTYAIQWTPELGNIPLARDVNGDEIIQRLMFHNSVYIATALNVTYAAFLGVWDEGPRLINLETMYYPQRHWKTITIGGNDYLQVKYLGNASYDPHFCGWLMPLSDLTI
ncbi:hypothetical protein LCGC14_1405530 [marine sediment metagenome]|uniref:Uncharacterized protein n=1 Tax=marine sediment metagenome TaxID=412755 RepID=A0A0F9MXD6_9ZZZZ